MEGKKLHGEAIAMLRDRHPDILVSGDYATHNAAIVPDNVQVYDQHTYTGLYQSLFAQTIQHKDFRPRQSKEERIAAPVTEGSVRAL